MNTGGEKKTVYLIFRDGKKLGFAWHWTPEEAFECIKSTPIYAGAQVVEAAYRYWWDWQSQLKELNGIGKGRREPSA